jgi:hypothetical protein
VLLATIFTLRQLKARLTDDPHIRKCSSMNARRFALLISVNAITACGPLLIAQNQSGMAPFTMDHRRGALGHSPVDVSFLLGAPAGKHGFVKVQGGHLVTGDGQRIRFWGVNITD